MRRKCVSAWDAFPAPIKEANPIDDFKAVRSSLDISRQIADLLEQADPHTYHGMNRTRTIRRTNDILQGRDKQTVDELLAGVDAVCGSWKGYDAARATLHQRIQDFQHQKELLTQPYTKSSGKIFDFDEEGTKPIINQQLYDQAAQEGFPIGFFHRSYFDHVTFYCLPDHADFSFSILTNCTFAVCRIREATFDGACIFSSEFHNCAIDFVSFRGTILAHTHFHDSTLQNVSFQEARLKSCNTVDCELDGVGFLNATLDNCFFGRVAARGIRGLHTATITQGGAASEEVRHNREAILSALRPQGGEQRGTPPKARGGR